MLKKQVWRYYCEHCKKSGCSGYHIKKHEKSCTANPNRVCGMCGSNLPVAEFVAALGDGKDLAKIRELADNCPACILAGIRQSKLQYFDMDEEGPCGFHVHFDFNIEKAEWWQRVGEEEMRLCYVG